MKRSIGILLGLALAIGAGSTYARGGGHGGGGHAGGGTGGRPAMGGGGPRFTTGPMHFTTGAPRFTTGTMRFTTGPHPAHPISGIRPVPPIVRPIPPHHHGGTVIVSGGVVFGAPFWYPPYPYPYYAYAPDPYAPYAYVPPSYGGSDSSTPTYIEQGNIAYYCPDYQDYYPNVQSCPSPWMQVLPGTSN